MTWAAIVTGVPTLQFIQSDIDSVGDVRESRAYKLCQPPSVQLSSVSQSCLTLCNPMECGTPGSSVHGIFQARILDWVVISYSGDLPDQGVKPTSLTSPTLGGGFLTTMPPGKLQIYPQLFTNTLCNPMDYSKPGFPVHHLLPKLTQTPVHRAGDAIQLSHLLSSPSPPTFNLSQHQSFIQ